MSHNTADYYDTIISQYTNKKNINGEEVLEFIDAVVGRYGFCLSNWIRELIEKSYGKKRTYADKFYFDETIEERWQRIYRGKISSFQEIVTQVRDDKIVFKTKAKHMLGKIRWRTNIFYLNSEKLIDILKNEKELDEIVDYWKNYLNPARK